MPGASALTVNPFGSVAGGMWGRASGGPANPQDLNRYAYALNSPLKYTDPTGHCGKSSFGDTAMSVMSGDCTRRAYEALTNADTPEEQLVSGAVMVTSAIGAGAGWTGSALLGGVAGRAALGALATRGAATAASGAATAASADGDPTNEARAIAERTITLVQREGNIVEYALNGPKGQMNVMAELVRKGETIVLRGVHVEGAGRGSQGIRELREFARLFAREQGVTKIVIEGGQRTTGANPGHIPRDIVITVK